MMPPGPPLGDFTSVPIATNIPQIVWSGVQGSTVLLANQDLTNAVTIARRPSFAIGAGNTANVPALGSLTVDGSKSIWGLAPANTAELLVLPGGSQWAPSPAQIAEQISALGLATFNEQVNQNTSIPNNISTTGVPLLTQSTVLLNLNAQGIAASGSFQSSQIATNQIGYELLLVPAYPVTNGNNPFIYVVVGWWDSISGLLVDKQSFVTCVNSHTGINSLPTRIKGPSKADQVQITIYNQDTTQGIVCTIVLTANSRVLSQDYIDWPVDQSENGASIIIPGHTLAGTILPDTRTIAIASNTSLAASGQDGWLIPPHSGLAYLNILESGVAAGNIAVSWQPLPSSIYSTPTPWLVNDVLGAGDPDKLNYPQVIMPNAPTQLNIKNNGTVPASYVAMITGA